MNTPKADPVSPVPGAQEKAVACYIAAPYPLRDAAVKVMRALESQGIAVTSTWLKAPDEMADQFARVDLADVSRADVLLALNPSEWANAGTGGRHVEFGYALALGKPIILVGERSNIFHHLSSIRIADDSEDLAKLVAKAAQQRRDDIITRENAVAMIVAEFSRAERKHRPMHSPHEGYAVIREELDELWTEIKADRGRSQDALLEAVQTAAMGVRYVRDLAPSIDMVAALVRAEGSPV